MRMFDVFLDSRLTQQLKRRQIGSMKADGIGRVWRSRVLLAAAMVGCCACTGQSLAQSRQSPLVGKPAPKFQLQGVYNETYSLDQFKGHILVMQFGSSW
jgi:hypothetical protein